MTAATAVAAGVVGAVGGDALLQTADGMGSVLGLPVRSIVRAAGLAVLAFALGGGIGLVHRWYADQPVPEGLSVLVGLSGVALSLNTDFALAQVIDDQTAVLSLEAAVFNVSVFLAAGLLAAAGGRAGDRLGAGAFALSGADRVEGEVSKVVRAVGRVVTVELPEAEDIDDIEGYDPVSPETKTEFGGATLVFPRRLTVVELRRRLVERLKTDYGVGQVDVEIDEDGVVEYLAVGSRESGIGPSLPPGTAAVPVRADPPNAARAGDVVQVFRPTDGDPERVTTAEVRGNAGDTVTLAVDEEETEALDDTTRYRLVTLPTSPRADHEFASLLRAAEETMGVATIAEGSPLVGVSLGGVAVSVAAVRPAVGTVEAIPSRTRTFAAGDTVYAVARPALLRRLEAAARGDAGADPPLAGVSAGDDD